MHVPFIGRLTVEHPRSVVGLRGLGLDHREFDVPEAHAAPLRRHVGEPEAGGPRLVPHLEEGVQVLRALDLVGVADLRLAGSDDLLDEVADPEAQLLELGTEGEVDGHGGQPPPIREWARAKSPSVMAWSRSPVARGALPAQARACVPSSTMPSLKHARTTYQPIVERSRSDRSA